MSWPRVPVLPEPDEDIRILGVPVGRLFWLGPLFVLPLLFAALLMSLGAVAALPIALVFFLALYALFGLDLWRSTYWAMTWWLRPERRGKVVEVGSAPPSAAGPAAHPPAARAASLRSRLVSRLGEVRPAGEMGPEPGTLALVDPPAVEYTDPESLWRRWGDALRRAIRRGATVQVVTWVEPDWDAAMWERERRAVLRAGDGGLGDLAAQRWVLHRALSVAVGRRVVHGIRVVPGPGTPRDALADLARHCAAALAGAGNWVMPDRESRAQVCRRALDWAGWFTTIGGGTPELSALWRGWSVEDATGQVDRSPANSGYVDNSVDSDVNSEDVPDMRWDGEPAEAGEPLQDPDATETAADTGLASVEEPSDAGEAVAMRVSPDDEGEALSDTTAVRVGNTQNGGEPESGWDETKESANAAVGEKEMGDILASGPRFRFLGIPPLTAALPGLRPLRRRSDESSGEDERLNTPGHLDRPVRPLVAVW